jgi:hypothetical protein
VARPLQNGRDMRVDVKRAFAAMAIIVVCSLPVALLRAGAPDASLWHRVAAWRAGATFGGFDGVVRQRGVTDCGAAVLVMALQQFGRAVPAEQVYAALPPGERGVSLAALRDAAREFGLVAEGWRLNPDVLPAALPAVLFIGGDHFVLASRQLPDGRIEVLDPTRGRLLYRSVFLKRRWKGEAVVFCHADPNGRCTADRVLHAPPNSWAPLHPQEDNP